MKTVRLLVLLLAGISTALAQDGVITWGDMVQSAKQWASNNLDANTLNALQGTNQDQAQQFLDTLQKDFQGEYVVNLAPLRQVATVLLPILQSRQETLPYAVWLKARMDYLETADALRLSIPPPNSAPGTVPEPPPNPSAKKEREIWIKEFAGRPLPENAKAYVATLKPVFAEAKVPPQLVWIAEVESSFDPRARSPMGAEGLFQLMPATARRYGLRTWPFDQRDQPEDSARAAAKYLNYLHTKFGDWRLALAAYNAGEGTIHKLLDRHKDKTYDAIATELPAETQMFVPKVEATLFEREGVKLSDLSPSRESSG